MGMNPQIFHKTTLDARIRPQPVAAPEERQERDGPSMIKQLYVDLSAQQLGRAGAAQRGLFRRRPSCRIHD
jgi:hypothetical protein